MNDIIYKNPKDLEGLITNTYILAVVAAVVFVGIAVLIAQLIAYEGGKSPRDPGKRRVWFFVTAFICIAAFFSWNYFVVKEQIKPVPALVDEFLTHSAFATGVALLVYLVIGFAISKLMKRGKFGTVFPSRNA